LRTLGLGVLMLTALAALSAASATAPPAPGTKKTVPEGHAKASSYAPQPRSPHRAYGAPIQRPILGKRKRYRHHTENPQAK